jgi:hypothetical protein
VFDVLTNGALLIHAADSTSGSARSLEQSGTEQPLSAVVEGAALDHSIDEQHAVRVVADPHGLHALEAPYEQRRSDEEGNGKRGLGDEESGSKARALPTPPRTPPRRV